MHHFFFREREDPFMEKRAHRAFLVKKFKHLRFFYQAHFQEATVTKTRAASGEKNCATHLSVRIDRRVRFPGSSEKMEIREGEAALKNGRF